MNAFGLRDTTRVQFASVAGLAVLAAVLTRLAMLDYAKSSAFFHPHGYCYLWQTGLVGAHVVSDGLIGLSYIAISATLIYLVWRARRLLPFSWMFVSFGVFIVACGATHLIDVATLTGACVVALGKTTSGLFGTPPSWVEDVRRASERAGDRSWPMPVFDDYKEALKSEIADMSNTGGRPGGAITAALFIKEFTGDLPWVHIDIAGTAWAEEPKPYQPKGATGVSVRTLVELARDVASWRVLDE